MKQYQIFLMLAVFMLTSLALAYLNRRNCLSSAPKVATERIVDLTEPMVSPDTDLWMSSLQISR
jgi:hypothetical protein